MMSSDLTVAILAGGDSKRFATYKATAYFRGQPLIQHMISIANQISSRVLIVLSNDSQREKLSTIVNKTPIVIDPEGSVHCALSGAITAFEFAGTRYTLLLPVDTPLANVDLLKTLVSLREGHGAVVPTWPSGYVEPLHAVYFTEHAYAKGLQVLADKKYRMQDLLSRLSKVLYVSTLVLKTLDSQLNTFVNINTEQDLRALERVALGRN